MKSKAQILSAGTCNMVCFKLYGPVTIRSPCENQAASHHHPPLQSDSQLIHKIDSRNSSPFSNSISNPTTATLKRCEEFFYRSIKIANFITEDQPTSESHRMSVRNVKESFTMLQANRSKECETATRGTTSNSLFWLRQGQNWRDR
jgi:hypothetical protein